MKHFIWLGLLILMTESAAINPDTVYHYDPASLGLPFEQATIMTEDSFSLNAWIFNPRKDFRGITIILSYSDQGNMGYFLTQAHNIRQNGYRVITYDYRGFGTSDPFTYNEYNLYHYEYVTDLKGVISFTQKKYPSDRICLYGISMGSIISVLAASESEVDYLVTESMVSDPVLINERLIRLKGGRTFVPVSAVKYPEKLSRINIPVLIFGGTGDDYAPAEESFWLMERNEHCRIIIFRGQHMQGFKVLSGQYPGAEHISYLNGFLDPQ